ncbi:c-Myc-binding protein isoform X1 [Dermacentor variabilis]|uniref:c-Myc-binding protein isoform X1 n=1 Tax=Dermacentor variabilis TaxID=34621 RepID=UPI003F5C9912
MVGFNGIVIIDPASCSKRLVESRVISAGRLFISMAPSVETFTPVDSKKEEFRKYLEKSGVFERLTIALVSLFEEQEKPENAIAYVKAHLDPDHSETTIDALKQELEQVRRQLEDLQIEHNHLKMQIAKGEVEEAIVAEPDL